MAGLLLDTAVVLPRYNISGDIAEEVEQLTGCIETLVENVNYILRHLSVGNFSDADVEAFGRAAARTVEAVANLYATTGDISDLTVDSLSTSKRVRMYLLGDTSDDNHIKVEGKAIQFVAAVNDGSVRQQTDRFGKPLYWMGDINAAVIDENGYPYLNGVRLFSSVNETPYPVMVYGYTEYVKAEYSFELIEGNYVPVMTFGAGTGVGNNGKGKIVKLADSMEILYVTEGGEERKIVFGDDGYIDIAKMRKPVKLDFSRIASGSFTETVDGGAEITYTVTLDGDGRIDSITDGEGHVTEVVWE